MARDHGYSTALHILASLAFRAPELVSSQVLARGLKTNPSLVRRVISRLSKAGLVRSIKGKNGGNMLAKAPSEIDLGEVYRAVRDGPLFETFDKPPYSACPVSCGIGSVLSEVYDELESGLERKMAKIKLSRVIDRLRR